MRTRRAAALAVALIALVGLIAGCGGSSGAGSTSDPPPTKSELRSGLLALSDLPTGFSTYHDTASGKAGPKCAMSSRGKGGPQVERGFIRGQLGPVVYDLLAGYPTDSKASRAFTTIVHGLRGCVAGNGSSKPAAISFPKIGDESHAFRITDTKGPGVGDFALVRTGRVVTVLVEGGLKVDDGQLVKLTRKAADKASSVG
jgi:hypothetical protein